MLIQTLVKLYVWACPCFLNLGCACAPSKTMDWKIAERVEMLLSSDNPEYEKVEWQIDELLAALDQARFPVIFTMPNADYRRTHYRNPHAAVGSIESQYGGNGR